MSTDLGDDITCLLSTAIRLGTSTLTWR